jgi:hypothetical protein
MMEVIDHPPQAGDAAGQVPCQVPLIAVVDADIRIYRPDEHAIHAAIALVEIVQVPRDRVLSGCRIVEIAFFRHRLRLDEVALRPQQLGPPVFGIVVAHADQALAPPLAQVVEPGIVCAASGDLPLAQFRYPIGSGHPPRGGYLAPIRRKPGILCRQADRRRTEHADEPLHHR